METRGPLTLRLRAPLRWRAVRTPAPAGREGAEDLSAYGWDALFATGDDGPRLRGALPAPAFTGVSAGAGGAADLSLEAGDWAFLQPARAPADDGELLALFEGFARDLWWEGSACEGPLYVRGVFEDGRRAVQLWRRLAT